MSKPTADPIVSWGADSRPGRRPAFYVSVFILAIVVVFVALTIWGSFPE